MPLMARPLRVEFPGAVYYLTTRGHQQQSIFVDDEDRQAFLTLLDEVVERYYWVCHAYCLMDNHYHLVIETLEKTLSKGMRQLNGMYTQRYNHRYQTTGQLFQGRFKSILLEKEAYLLELSRYAVLNPVRRQWMKTPQQWPWSSYRATAGEVEAPRFLDPSWLLSQLDHDIVAARDIYKTFVAEADLTYSPWRAVRKQMYLGSTKFCERFTSVSAENDREISARRPLEMIFDGQDKSIRLVEHAYHVCGYSQQEIADYLGVHYATVSRWLRKQERVNKEKRELAEI